MLSSLNTIDFQGSFILELSGEGNRDAEPILADARSVRNFLRSLALSSPPAMAAGRDSIS